ncbi:hypothetical protein MFLAVUS_004408 [Mucor flavus]|uniref:Uncharacterized protein n=1 Tax=Mucor flavus TaxID=439312 RepID=A0ABP9YVW9_9FUNG
MLKLEDLRSPTSEPESTVEPGPTSFLMESSGDSFALNDRPSDYGGSFNQQLSEFNNITLQYRPEIKMMDESVVTSKLQEVFVGPQVNVSPTNFTVNNTRLFLRSEEVSSFKKAFSSCLQPSSNYLPPSISCLRQLTSSFNHTSTYAYFRATLDDFNDTRFMPVTVFTLCDTPDQDGYGSNHNSAPKIENISWFQTAYESAQHNEDNESWKIIDQVMNQMNTLIEQNDDKPMKISKFILEVNLSKVANLVGNHLYKANQKVASNIKARLLDLYG